MKYEEFTEKLEMYATLRESKALLDYKTEEGYVEFSKADYQDEIDFMTDLMNRYGYEFENRDVSEEDDMIEYIIYLEGILLHDLALELTLAFQKV